MNGGDPGATVTLTWSTVDYNAAHGDGGGISNGGTVTLNHTRVSANTPDNCAPPGSVARLHRLNNPVSAEAERPGVIS